MKGLLADAITANSTSSLMEKNSVWLYYTTSQWRFFNYIIHIYQVFVCLFVISVQRKCMHTVATLDIWKP